MKSKYTKELLEPIVKSCISYNQILEKLGLRLTGGNNYYIRKIIREYALPTDHFLGQSWSKGTRAHNRKTPAQYLIVYPKTTTVASNDIKNKIFRDNIKEEKCENCGLSKWMGNKIPLEIHHKDGDRWNNTIDNIEILCCNCHSQTDNYGSRKRK